MKIVLASQSPRRARLFEQIGIDFITCPSGIEEKLDKPEPPERLAEKLAALKADSVSTRFSDALIIAADTVVTLGDVVLGKPEHSVEASKMLRLLSGRAHYVYTGVCVIRIGNENNILQTLQFTEQTKVTFSELSDREIERYIEIGSPFDKAGSYGIQDDLGSLFVEKIEGDYYNVVGFPLNRFYREMKKSMPDIFNNLFLK